MDVVTLEGKHVRLEQLEARHIEGLTAASAADPSLYKWSLVPQGRDAMARYVSAALALQQAGTTLAFATVRLADGVVVGSTRFFDIERYTWLTKSAIRTAANTEAKLLMLTHAFETWQMLRVCLHTDRRNEQSRAAMERIGARFEGILRAHRMAADFTARDSARYSIVAAEWPDVKRRLQERLAR